MALLRRIALLATVCAASLTAPASASAAPFDVLGFHFSSPIYFVHENGGAGVITIERTNVLQEAQIRYNTLGLTAVAPFDYTPQKGMIDFQPGQASATVTVPIVAHGTFGMPTL